MEPAPATAATITIVVADDHAVVRGGLRRLLDAEPDFEVVAEAGDVQQTLARMAEHRPSILLLDLHMPGGGSLPALRTIRDASPATGILILTMQDDPGYAREAMQRGARGYVLKEAEEADLLQAVRSVASGGTYLQPELGARLLSSPATPLTTRERDVLRLLALGHTNLETADRLHLSVRTVETHRANIQSKLGSASRAELVRRAHELGLVTA
ncbi:MAG: two-component system, NarL family, response regulator NreC [Thermoleophilaceae bacterium]|nr:two-component system, NarL family, response regulator NreC [Thermoleophilaceae bacterium]